MFGLEALRNIGVGAQAVSSAEASARPGPSDPIWWEGWRSQAVNTVSVSVERARRLPVVRDTLQAISNDVASLDATVVEMRPDGSTRPAADHPIAQLLDDPNDRQTRFEFIDQMVDDLASEGAAAFQQVTDARGRLVELHRLEPCRTRLDEVQDPSWGRGTRRFDVTDRFGRSRRFIGDEVWYVPVTPLVDNLRGRSPILDDGKETVAWAIALQDYASTYFTQSATPPFVIEMPAEHRWAEEDDRGRFMRAWEKMTGARGRNRHKPALLEYGGKITVVGHTPEEAQFNETWAKLCLDLARIWRMQPHKVGILDNATFSNIEHQSIEYVTHTLSPWLTMIEASINKHLIGPGPYRWSFNVQSLLRGDIKTRYEAYALGRQWGWLSVNDILRMESRNGIGSAGDRYMEPLNMQPVGVASQAPQRRAHIASQLEMLQQTTSQVTHRPSVKGDHNAT